jgi:hypothetical protein
LGFPTGCTYKPSSSFSSAVAGERRRIISLVNWAPSTSFSGAVAGEEEDFCKGSLARTLFYFVYCFAFLFFACIFLSKTQKI